MRIVQFNWRWNWSKLVRPCLDDPEVQFYLDFGMKVLDCDWLHGNCPNDFGSLGFSRPRARVRGLEWYRPHNRCHWISPFTWAIGRVIRPELQWGLYMSNRHTVSVGLDRDTDEFVVVMDILLFEENTAEESLGWVADGTDRLCNSPFEVFFDRRSTEAVKILKENS